MEAVRLQLALAIVPHLGHRLLPEGHLDWKVGYRLLARPGNILVRGLGRFLLWPPRLLFRLQVFEPVPARRSACSPREIEEVSLLFGVDRLSNSLHRSPQF